MLKKADVRAKELAKKRESGLLMPARGATEGECDAQLVKLDEDILDIRKTLEKKIHNQSTLIDVVIPGLKTCLDFYVDPRITIFWFRENDIPLELVFSKALLAKFAWALEIDDDWEY
ncbi:DNA topoisomerase 1 alpha [Mortierella sp. NVP41]|nr:DNA topoisomerase 1 alpha [Mortierella sp. NVP41]